MLSLPEVEVSFGGHPLISGLTLKVRGQIGESKKICVSVIFCFHYYLFNQKNERRPLVSFLASPSLLLWRDSDLFIKICWTNLKKK